ncbi:MAG: transposase [Candidatus Omnitrophota bacterium]
MPSYARKHQLQRSLVYHAFSRSNGRKVIFQEVEDFNRIKLLFGEYSERFQARIYHWAIMPTHYHLVVEFQEPELVSKFMAGVHRAYSHYYHKQYNAVGYLWQGRFKLQPIQKELYLKTCGRYVERNPVRAQIVKEACEYAHSSARFYCLGQEDGITRACPDFEEFGKNADARQIAYKKYLEDFNQRDEIFFSSVEAPCGDKDFLRKLVRRGDHYFPRRQGRKAAVFVL